MGCHPCAPFPQGSQECRGPQSHLECGAFPGIILAAFPPFSPFFPLPEQSSGGESQIFFPFVLEKPIRWGVGGAAGISPALGKEKKKKKRFFSQQIPVFLEPVPGSWKVWLRSGSGCSLWAELGTLFLCKATQILFLRGFNLSQGKISPGINGKEKFKGFGNISSEENVTTPLPWVFQWDHLRWKKKKNQVFLCQSHSDQLISCP